MTTPRDDIARLIGDIEDRRSHPAYPHHLDELFDEAATQLDSLSARVKELEEECSRLASDTCHAGYSGEHGHHRCREVDEAEASATRLQQERDELQLRHNKLTTLVGGTVIELGCAADSEAVFEAIAKLKQERDEAYERLKPFVDAADKLDDVAEALRCNDEEPIGDVMWPDDQPTAGNIRAARDLVRRLAGPEKIAAASDGEDSPPQEKI